MSGETTTTAVAIARIDGVAANEGLGSAVTGAGDVDRDGSDDLWVGAWGANGNGAGSGAGFLYYGPVAGSLTDEDADARFDGGAPSDQLGSGTAAGDLTGDGVIDLVAGALGETGGAAGSGVVWVLPGAP